MPTIIPTGTAGYSATADNENFILPDGNLLTSTGAGFDVGVYSGISLTVLGTMLADATGIICSSSSAEEMTIRIMESGSVIAENDGVDIRGDNSSLINYGEIVSLNSSGVVIRFSADSSFFENHGHVAGLTNGAFVGGAETVINGGTITGGNAFVIDDFNMTVFNSGEIRGAAALAGSSIANLSIGIATTGFGGGSVVFNTGLISGADYSLYCNASNITVFNQGMLQGDAFLSGGNDLFDTRGGTVIGTVFGNAGDDTFIIDDATMSLSENLDGGTDEVRARTDWTLGNNFETLTLIGGGDFDGIGNDLDNALTGNSGDNRLEGEGGLDTIDGGAGNDILLGGGGRDDIMGGTGDDTLRGQVGADTLAGGDGDDVVSGNAGDDVLSGDAGADTLIGGAGGDQLTGGGQGDVFLFRHQSDSANDAGWDTITDFAVGEDLIDLSRLVSGQIDFLGTAAFTGTGQAEMRVLLAGGGSDTRLRIDLDGDGNSDMRIDIDGVTGLTATDFWL